VEKIVKVYAVDKILFLNGRSIWYSVLHVNAITALSPPLFYRETAAELGLPVEEEALTMVLSDGSLRSDYIHPNAAGYRRLAESIASLLKKKSGAVE